MQSIGNIYILESRFYQNGRRISQDGQKNRKASNTSTFCTFRAAWFVRTAASRTENDASKESNLRSIENQENYAYYICRRDSPVRRSSSSLRPRVDRSLQLRGWKLIITRAAQSLARSRRNYDHPRAQSLAKLRHNGRPFRRYRLREDTAGRRTAETTRMRRDAHATTYLFTFSLASLRKPTTRSSSRVRSARRTLDIARYRSDFELRPISRDRSHVSDVSSRQFSLSFLARAPSVSQTGGGGGGRSHAPRDR